MSKTLFRESVSGDLTKKGNRWKGVLAVPGQGASGYYSEAVLQEYGPQALAPGAKAFVEHNPERPVRDMIGIYPDGAYYEEGVGLVGELEVFPHWREFVEAVAPHTGLSIYMMGESDDEGNVTALIPDRQNGVDLVSYPGLEGSQIIEKLYESAVALSHDGTTPVVQPEIHSKENNMEIEALAAKVDALAESVTALVGSHAALVESLKPVEVPAEETDLAAVVEAAVEAGLPRESRDVVVESVKAGAKVDEAIASQKALVESIRKQVTEAVEATGAGVQGRIVESGGAAGFSLADLGKATR
jgi:hypothetical protein